MEKEKLNIGRKSAFSQPLKVDRKGISFDDYGAKPLVEIDAEDTMYNTFRKTAKKRMDKVCIRHNTIEYTYAQVLEMIDKFAASLDLSGIKKGDVVALPLEHSIEASVALIAINKIGAISKWVDIEKSSMELYDNFKDSNVKFIIASNSLKSKIAEVNKKLDLPDSSVLLVDTYNEDKNFYDFLNKSSNHDIQAVEYDKDMPAIMITSSGTTGKPKNILHSSFSVNSAVKKITYTDYPIKDNIMLVAIPPYIGLGLVTSLYSSMICGGETEILSDYKSPFAYVEYINKNIDKLKKLPKNKKILLFAAPVFFKSMNSYLKDIDDLSFIGAMVAAGNKIDEKTLKEMDDNFKSKNCNVPVCNAYGQNEHCGGITYNTIKFNKRGSAGKVAYGTRVMIVNPKTKEEVPVNEIGKIVEQSDSKFLGYDNNPEAEEASVFVDKDGEIWFDTKDLGSFDDDNYLHVFDRESRAIIRFDFKVTMASIENKILRNNNVKEAIAVKVIVDTPFGKDQAPYLFVVLRNNENKIDSDKLIEDIQSSDYPLSMLETPVCVEFLTEEQIPYKNNKIDYLKLEQIAQKMIESGLNFPTENKEKVKRLT